MYRGAAPRGVRFRVWSDFLGTWYLSLTASLVLILVGMYIHWSVVAVGLLLPFIPMLSFVLTRRSERRRAADNHDAGRDDGPGST